MGRQFVAFRAENKTLHLLPYTYEWPSECERVAKELGFLLGNDKIVWLTLDGWLAKNNEYFL